ncbi:MAG: DUF4157 domain-containing protein [Spirochaetales bacterium]|nr:DUF4157 domain-containing protein [Spirochaetales bacterium]
MSKISNFKGADSGDRLDKMQNSGEGAKQNKNEAYNKSTDSNSLLILNDSASENKATDFSMGLDASLKNQFERAFDADFSKVRIHTGRYANEIASKASADAVTVGHDIYFASGNFRPDTEEGIQLLAHELQHVIQNQDSRRMVYLEDISMLEYEASNAADKLKNMKLHEISGPVLNQSENAVKNEEDINRSTESQNQDSSAPRDSNGSKENFEDFLKKPDESIIRYHTANGETIILDLNQYKEGKEQVLKELELIFEEKRNILPEKAYEAELLRFVDYINKM